ncbi:hypothetical protein WICMUC_000188 [Wickerhamomyces mucosus]|uniref:Uncharacterized protein n=1 Tax=Wickerhamomyces mucosus TaxID=1378264 RepID=A0A9P8PY81_9ASCO|nr:hypothetical protein WICMUC_000188 [Wickerhamomyces mucosus]
MVVVPDFVHVGALQVAVATVLRIVVVAAAAAAVLVVLAVLVAAAAVVVDAPAAVVVVVVALVGLADVVYVVLELDMGKVIDDVADFG